MFDATADLPISPRLPQVELVVAQPTVLHCTAMYCTACREVADRILGVREHISKELLEELALIPEANTDVKRK
jgi:hypothetical protein